MIEAMVLYYDHNPDFKNYVDKYCIKNNIDLPQDAMSHYIIQDVYKYYLDLENRRVNV